LADPGRSSYDAKAMPEERNFVRPCAEFPNDNPALHDGVSWVCLRVGAPLRPIAHSRAAPLALPAATAARVVERPVVVPMSATAAARVEEPVVVVEVPAVVAARVEEPVVIVEVPAVAAVHVGEPVVIVETPAAPAVHVEAARLVLELPDIDPRMEFPDYVPTPPQPSVQAVQSVVEPTAAFIPAAPMFDIDADDAEVISVPFSSDPDAAEITEALLVALGEATAPPPSVYALSTDTEYSALEAACDGTLPDVCEVPVPGESVAPESPDMFAAPAAPEPRVQARFDAPAPLEGVAAAVARDGQRPSLEDLSLEWTPAKSEVRAVLVAPDNLELEGLDVPPDEASDGEDVFSFDADDGDNDLAENEATSSPREAVIDVFDSFVAVLVAVADASGANAVATALPTLLAGEPVASDPVSELLRRAPAASASVFDNRDGRISLSAASRATTEAWRAVLRGESGDLSACGTTTLDGWAGDILRGLGVGADGGMDVRRELRRRGVAAFGMLVAA
jgi:hypothetical protein